MIRSPRMAAPVAFLPGEFRSKGTEAKRHLCDSRIGPAACPSISALGSRVYPLGDVGCAPPDPPRSEIDRQWKVARLNPPPDRCPAADTRYLHHVLTGQQFGDGHRYLSMLLMVWVPSRRSLAIEAAADGPLGKVINALCQHEGNQLRSAIGPSRPDVRHAPASVRSRCIGSPLMTVSRNSPIPARIRRQIVGIDRPVRYFTSCSRMSRICRPASGLEPSSFSMRFMLQERKLTRSPSERA